MKKILIASDFSACAQAALDRALQLIPDASVTLLHIHSLPAYVLPDGTVYTLDSETAKSIEESIRAHLQAEQKRAGVPMELVSVEGNPPEVIVNFAAKGKFDLIVMGTHGRTGMRRLLLGSIAERVLRSAPCAVMVVREAT